MNNFLLGTYCVPGALLSSVDAAQGQVRYASLCMELTFWWEATHKQARKIIQTVLSTVQKKTRYMIE